MHVNIWSRSHDGFHWMMTKKFIRYTTPLTDEAMVPEGAVEPSDVRILGVHLVHRRLWL